MLAKPVAMSMLMLLAFSTACFPLTALSQESVDYPASIVFGAFGADENWFSPDPLYVRVGDTVTWTNHDMLLHTVTAGHPSDETREFESPYLAPLQSFSHTFTTSGTFQYFDQLRPFLTGTVIVGDERSPLPGIVAAPDKVTYNAGETVTVSGRVADVDGDRYAVIQIHNPNGAAYRLDQISPASDGSFSYTFGIGGPLGIPGDYEVILSYGDSYAELGFRLLAQLHHLTINTVLEDGTPLNMWTVIKSPTADGTNTFAIWASGIMEVPQGINMVTVHDYLDSRFSHWEDGSTERSRAVDLSGNTTITAYYTNGDSKRGFTPMTFDEDGPDLTVEALSIADDRPLHMWTRIENLGTEGDERMYTVTVHDYISTFFDHWEDGSMERTRTFVIGEDTVVRAYYHTR